MVTQGRPREGPGLALATRIFPARRIGAGVLAHQLDWLKNAAEHALATIDIAVEQGLVTRAEAKPLRDGTGIRIRHPNRTLHWDIPAATDAVVSRGGGWQLS